MDDKASMDEFAEREEWWAGLLEDERRLWWDKFLVNPGKRPITDVTVHAWAWEEHKKEQ